MLAGKLHSKVSLFIHVSANNFEDKIDRQINNQSGNVVIKVSL